MQNHYPLWKNLLVLIVFAVSTIYALPNLYGDDPSVQVASTRSTKLAQEQANKIESDLKASGLNIKQFEFNNGQVLARFNSTDDQLKAADLLRDQLSDEYNVALNLAPTTPPWLRALGAKAMYLGLDLRGGVHFLMEVDMDAAVKQAEDRYTDDVRLALRNEKIRYQSVAKDSGFIKVKLSSADDKPALLKLLGKDFRALEVTEPSEQDQVWLKLSEKDVRETKKFAVAQNMTTLRNRVNELGVAEPVIQQQGEKHIVVQLPGVQDTTRAKEILGTTATLEYRLVDVEHDVQQAVEGHVPVGSRLYYERNGNPILLDRRVIVTGDQIVDSSSGVDQDGRPSVNISLNGVGAAKMGKLTQANIGKPMAVVFIEYKVETKTVNGQKVRHKEKVEKVINVATIQGVFSHRFQTTGLDSPQEARNLSLLLRAGALVAPIDIVEERTVGPSLGQENIGKGVNSNVYGFIAVAFFMIAYYRLFGLFSIVALSMNVLMLVAVLSLLQATLTLPGMAGIALTVGMAIDANVLINERIREELRIGMSPGAAIYAGYERAFATILDSNITTLIAGIALFTLGSGPIRGFALVLCIGILTSMFSAVVVSRALVNLAYGGQRQLDKLAI
ncbi:protein translocase subunit SecD [Candidatus Methylobacter oryzae]|uniref:Protein translocase subunit SecD n=1 Tax=Candidatus Methylobacter oryzae TaxID=2497749 RepID=A0ABY3C814_9GAMM|nr:protein translocase subunit SecD [Candidatus Methylobacter oryzae]TRW92677.1 protein translocase subunit SecD [Candidatus Methylobacter oryzae]